ncbi:hypothetical protein Lesp02_01560 [Lentzea sp. NBRC 105346]|uniref:hypothetical protein n=1 Tax=Lentzea sp. NBRC 105346 TaxID=3032205 RepID=UPI0024A2B066|nr:hypothetical protein [Lentzea sp. NBRC 105346]GLZ27966.1 hypothetical protein Lesp02_01560 [Lentzea sp. NBRC 105346]
MDTMTPPFHGRSDDATAARRMLDSVTSRAALHEAAGAVLAWGGGDPAQALEMLCDRHSEAEVARVTARVDAEADRRSDPDWGD